MYHYWDVMVKAHEYDVRTARVQAKYENLRSRICESAFRMSDRQFIKRYRLSKDLVKYLITAVTPHMPPTLRSDALDVETKVRILPSVNSTRR